MNFLRGCFLPVAFLICGHALQAMQPEAVPNREEYLDSLAHQAATSLSVDDDGAMHAYLLSFIAQTYNLLKDYSAVEIRALCKQRDEDFVDSQRQILHASAQDLIQNLADKTGKPIQDVRNLFTHLVPQIATLFYTDVFCGLRERVGSKKASIELRDAWAQTSQVALFFDWHLAKERFMAWNSDYDENVELRQTPDSTREIFEQALKVLTNERMARGAIRCHPHSNPRREPGAHSMKQHLPKAHGAHVVPGRSFVEDLSTSDEESA